MKPIAPQERIAQDLLLMGLPCLLASFVFFFSGHAFTFVFGSMAVSFSLGVLFSAFVAEWRSYHLRKFIGEPR